MNTTIFLNTLGRLEVGCVWGRWRWGEKKKKVGELCVWGEGEKGGGRCGERREVLHMISFRGGGGVKIFWKSGGICMARGDLSYAFTRGFGGMLPRENF